ncbi:MAG TPA: DNA alkylation repair protein [Flavipsychrobacter sp.]|nr:DNA alkylation repair protein [Flavipsychrobacter sp.]
MQAKQIIKLLQEMGNAANLEGMKRYAIDTSNSFGVNMPEIRAFAKSYKRDHELALQLWDSGIREAMILASLIDDPKMINKAQINKWVKDFNSWDVCDQTCINLFKKTPYAIDKAKEFSTRKDEYVKRTGFVLMACYAVDVKTGNEETFDDFLTIIEREAWDGRNFVKKAINWALRQIGKRNDISRKKAISTAKRILKQSSKSAQWIAKDALKELEKEL